MTSFPGDPFSLSTLLLPRPACAYGLQKLGTDQLWSSPHAVFYSIRQVTQADLFQTFEAAAAAGLTCLLSHPDTPLAIVPIGHDPVFDRFVLIHGVIQP